MALSSKDLTIFSFTRKDAVNSSLLYKMCENSWRKAFPGANIIKFDMEENIEKYRDNWFYSYLDSKNFLPCYYTDPLRIFKSLEIPNSIYIDSDVYIHKSPLDVINKSISNGQSFCGLCYYYFNNGNTPEIKRLYDFYTGNHTDSIKYKIKKYHKITEDAAVWNITGFRIGSVADFVDHAHFCSFTRHPEFVFVPCHATVQSFCYLKTTEIKPQLYKTVVFVDPDYPRVFDNIAMNVYITNNMPLFTKLAENFGAARNIPVSSSTVSFNQLFPKIIDYKYKAALLEVLKPN